MLTQELKRANDQIRFLANGESFNMPCKNCKELERQIEDLKQGVPIITNNYNGEKIEVYNEIHEKTRESALRK